MSSVAREFAAGALTVASPPLVYEHLVRVINDPRSGPADIGQVISDDPGLTARLLKIVNSAFFAFPRRIETVTQAVTVVGTSQIRELAFATSVISMFDDVPGDLVDMKSFWHHSIACGVTARVIAAHRREANVEQFFVAGLLHDIGRLIIFAGAGREAREAIERARESEMPLHVAEREILGCDHAQVGGALMERWNISGAHREAVAYHHAPRLASRFPVEAAAVHVADIVAHALEWGRSGETRVPPFEPKAWETLGVETSLLPFILDEAERQEHDALHLLGAEA